MREILKRSGDKADLLSMAFVRFVMGHRRWFVVLSLIFIALQGVFVLLAMASPRGVATQARSDDCVSVAGHQVCSRVGRLPKTASTDTASYADPLYGHVVSTLSDRSVLAWCWSKADWRLIQAQRQAQLPHARRLVPWSAYTRVERPPSVHLSPEVCAELARLVSDPDPVWSADDVDALAWSAHVLAHESVHARGILNEAVAECRGLQTTGKAVVLLGRSKEEAAYLATVYWKHMYPTLAGYFHSPECHDGGRLDLRKSTHWP